MSYRLDKGESALEGVKRIAAEQVGKAIHEIEAPDLDAHETVHQVRKRCKKIRALVRLVRPGFEDTYKFENAWYRDAARELSYIRDARSILEIYEKITSRYQEQLAEGAFAPIGQFLLDRQASLDEAEIGHRLVAFSQQMKEGKSRIDAWSFEDQGFDAVSGGLRKTYKRGRKAFSGAYRHPDSGHFHEWRKRVKYHWYHARLLKNIWPEAMDAYQSELHSLSDYLGDLHDLAVLEDTLARHKSQIDPGDSLQVLFALIKQERENLRRRARLLGKRIYCTKPGALAKLYGCYWEAWRGMSPGR
jgi:CHAD domain-containing protein